MSAQFDHEKLDVYQVSLKFAAFTANLVNGLKGDFRSARDQLIRSSQSIPLNIAEGNGKRSMPDRRRFFEIARGSATESIEEGKTLLLRIVAMLSKMTVRDQNMVREAEEEYGCEEESEHN